MTNQTLEAVVVLAAGAGTRMKSSTPKVLHELGGHSMLRHALNTAAELHPRSLLAVVKHERDRIAAHVTDHNRDVVIVDQGDVPGTGSAVEAALAHFDDQRRGTVLVTYGDVPLLTAGLLGQLLTAHWSHNASATVLTAQVADPAGYGRILRDFGNNVLGIVEHKDATEEQRKITEVNSGIYAFELPALREALEQVGVNNSQGEKYLTDVLAVMRAQGHRISALVSDDPWQIEGANDRVQLAQLARELNRRITEKWMRAGVSIIDPDTTWIDSSVELEPDSTILPGTQLHGTTVVSSGAVVGPDTTLTNVSVGAGATVTRTHGSESEVGAGAQVGPFAYLRPGTRLGEDSKIGAFVETKNAQVGQGSKIPHLTYVGDAVIGDDSNIGAGAVFANYDGVHKNTTRIGNGVRTGSGSIFVAPVTLADGSYTGAGTVVRKDVPAGALAINHAPQRVLEGWVGQNRPGTSSAAAAEVAGDSPDA